MNGQEFTKHIFDWPCERLAFGTEPRIIIPATLAQYYVRMAMAVVSKIMIQRVVLWHCNPRLCAECRVLLQDPETRTQLICADASDMMQSIIHGYNMKRYPAWHNGLRLPADIDASPYQQKTPCTSCSHELYKIQERVFVYGALTWCPFADRGIRMYMKVLERIVTFCPQALSIRCDDVNCFEQLEQIWEDHLKFQTDFHLQMYASICRLIIPFATMFQLSGEYEPRSYGYCESMEAQAGSCNNGVMLFEIAKFRTAFELSKCVAFCMASHHRLGNQGGLSFCWASSLPGVLFQHIISQVQDDVALTVQDFEASQWTDGESFGGAWGEIDPDGEPSEEHSDDGDDEDEDEDDSQLC